MINVNIDGKDYCATKGETLLSVAKRNFIHIPALCHNEAVAAYGSCRVCMVEIWTKKGKNKLVTACLFPVEDGLRVETKNDRVMFIRRQVAELLLAKCPGSTEVAEIAAEVGVTQTKYRIDKDGNKCILCALCTRVCDEVVGRQAISLVNRGINREVAIPFYDNAAACIACGSCAYVCPTDAITINDADGVRTITMPNCEMKFTLMACTQCGRHWIAEKQVKYFLSVAPGLTIEQFDLCPSCRK